LEQKRYAFHGSPRCSARRKRRRSASAVVSADVVSRSATGSRSSGSVGHSRSLAARASASLSRAAVALSSGSAGQFAVGGVLVVRDEASCGRVGSDTGATAAARLVALGAAARARADSEEVARALGSP